MQALRAAFSTTPMRALWDDEAIVASMLRFEAALAQAQAQCDLIPASAAQAIAAQCETVRLDVAALVEQARRAGTPAIPLVKALKAQLSHAAPDAAPYLHYGATSQDVCDTALVCVSQAALQQIYVGLRRLGDALATLVERHARTAMLARTLLQPAAPISFGWKAAGWLDAVARCAHALRDAGEGARVLQFGGANGTLVAHHAKAHAVTSALAERLGLQASVISWHGAHDRLARLGNELAILCGMVGKFGRDISLLMQPEVGEAFEPHAEGRGGSSAMPHKRNPVACMHMLDAAYRAPALALTLTGELTAEHERGLGSWPNALPVLADLFMLAGNSLDAAVEVAEGLRVEPHAMQANIDRMHGVVFSEGMALLLTRKLGSANAQRIVSELCNEATARHVDLRDLASRHDEVRAAATGAEINAACSQTAHLDAAQAMCTAVLEAWRTSGNFC